MNYGAEPADQVVRYSLEGMEYSLKITGNVAKHVAVFIAAALKDQKKTRGKTRLTRMLKEQRPMKFFTVPVDRLKEFAKEAKARGLSDRMVLACLLHDASECYMSDVPSPFKRELPEYNEREERMLSMIYEKFLGSDLTPEEKMQLNAIDKAMLWYDLTFLLGEKQESEAPELHIDLRYEVRAFGEVEEEYRRIFEEQLITVQNKRI